MFKNTHFFQKMISTPEKARILRSAGTLRFFFSFESKLRFQLPELFPGLEGVRALKPTWLIPASRQ